MPLAESPPLREAEAPVVASMYSAELLAVRGRGMREQVAVLLYVSPDDLCARGA